MQGKSGQDKAGQGGAIRVTVSARGAPQLAGAARGREGGGGGGKVSSRGGSRNF